MTTAAGALFRLRVLGSPELVDELGHTPRALGRGKPLALLCYLAVRGEARRDEIVDLLWRDVDEEKARNAFRQALHRLRTALGDDVVPRERDRLRLGLTGKLVVDLAEFERAAAAGRLDEAVELYSGDFLDGFDLREPAFDLWADQERTRLRGRFRQILHDAALAAGGDARWDEAIARTKRLLNITPFDPDTAKLAATTLVSAGRRIEALELLRDFTVRVERELGIPARPDIQALMTRLGREATTQEPRVAAVRASDAATPTLPLIGRRTELAQLLTMWRSVGENAGALALIEGETGSGKSRLVRELVSHVRSLGPALVLSGHERFAGAQVPFGIFGEALKPAVRAPGVAGASAHLLAEAARLLPEMRDVFDLPAVSPVEDEPARLRFFEGLAAMLDAAAYEQHTLVVLEDVQHLPPSSLDLLSYLVARLAAAPVMFVLTAQPSGAPAQTMARLRAVSSDAAHAPHGTLARRIELPPLAPEDVAAALRDSASSLGVPPAVIPAIVRAADGNPLRLMQAIRTAAAGEPLSLAPVPLKDVLLERFQSLASGQRRVVLVLALLARPVRLSLLAGASHVSETAAREAALRLERLGWIEREGEYLRVTNDLAASVVVDAAGAASRAFMAGWIADALAAEPDATDADLARLFAMAGRPAEAFDRARRAGFRALAAGAAAEATQLFGLARTFASSPEDLRAVEAALDSLGAGRRRIAAGTVPEPFVTGEAWTRSGQTATVPARPRPDWWRSIFPHWQVLLTAAVATAIITAVALGAREGVRGRGVLDPDTLMLVDGRAGARNGARLAIGTLADGFSVSDRVERATAIPAWIDSTARPWSMALPSPRGDRVALARSDSGHERLIVVTADRHDTLDLNVTGNAAPLGWSPDGTRLVARVTRRHAVGAFDTDLLAFDVTARGVSSPVVIDSTASHAVTEALWSPDGSHVAWVARAAPKGQLEVFASLADGSDPRNISRSPADDYHIAWSPAGDLLAFTSTRDGNPELYVADLTEDRLFRLTTNVAHDDRATFAPSGRFIAFESTRDGFGGVYAIPALGGQVRPIVPRRPFDIAGWRAAQPRYVDRLRVDASSLPDIGATGTVTLRAFDRRGDSMSVQHVEWTSLDTAVVRFSDDTSADGVAVTRTVRAVAPGLARVVATVGRWRADTATLRVGDRAVTLLDERFDANWERRWRVLGDPEPVLHRSGSVADLVLRAARDWDSGILSRSAFPLLPGLVVEADISAPLIRPPDAATVVTVALAAPEQEEDVDPSTPQLLRLVSLSWSGESHRLAYSVGREVFTEPLDSLRREDRLSATIRIERDSTVSFVVDGARRWRSQLRLSGAQFGTRAQLWISARASADQVSLARVRAAIASSRDTVNIR